MKIDKNVQCVKCVRRSGAPQKELLCLCPRCMHAHQILQRQHFKNAKPPCLGVKIILKGVFLFSCLQWFHEILKYVITKIKNYNLVKEGIGIEMIMQLQNRLHPNIMCSYCP